MFNRILRRTLVSLAIFIACCFGLVKCGMDFVGAPYPWEIEQDETAGENVSETGSEELGTMEVYTDPDTDDTEETASDTVIDTDAIVDAEAIPEYSGTATIEINGGTPYFTDEWDQLADGEICLSELDGLGRCGAAIMKATPESLPTGERGETGQAKPSGWVQNKYEGLINSDPPYLYNRSHLLMWALCGLTDDTRNLITGTRYFNLEMLNTEEEVLDRVKNGDTVLYRVTPLFEGGDDDDLLAKGVLMEAANADGSWQICRFVYNVQPGIHLDYATGENYAE